MITFVPARAGFWPESDARCPSCRNSGRVAEGGAR